MNCNDVEHRVEVLNYYLKETDELYPIFFIIYSNLIKYNYYIKK